MFVILVVVNEHNTARVASCWFIIYYRLAMHGNSNIEYIYIHICVCVRACARASSFISFAWVVTHISFAPFIRSSHELFSVSIHNVSCCLSFL